jgi:hypothetical protein
MGAESNIGAWLTEPLRRRMIENMTVRNLSPATQQRYGAPGWGLLCRGGAQDAVSAAQHARAWLLRHQPEG